MTTTPLTPIYQHRLKWVRRRQAVKDAIHTWGAALLILLGCFFAYWLVDDLQGTLVIRTRAQYERELVNARIEGARKMMETMRAETQAPGGPTLKQMFVMPRRRT